MTTMSDILLRTFISLFHVEMFFEFATKGHEFSTGDICRLLVDTVLIL